MYIKRVFINNYKTLVNVELKSLNSLVILIGRNSCGKSNLLEGVWLFFRDFSLSRKSIIKCPLTGHESMWFESCTDAPIEFKIEIELSEKESKFIAPKLSSSTAGNKCSIKIIRQIVAEPPKMFWETISLQYGDVVLIKSGKKHIPKQLIDKAKIKQLESRIKEIDDQIDSLNKKSDSLIDRSRISVGPVSDFVISPEKMVLSSDAIAIAYQPNAYVISPNYLQNSFAQIDPRFLPRPKTVKDLEEDKKRISGEILEVRAEAIRNIKETIKRIESEVIDKINYILSSRNNPIKESDYGLRVSLIQNSTNSDIVSSGETLSSNRKKWKKLKSTFERLTSNQQQLTIAQKQVIVEETNFSSPLSLTGAGTQETVELLHEIYGNDKPIVFVEEPEQHLHADLAKKLLSELKVISNEKQIWISTHSPYFLDKNDIRNVSLITIKNNKSEILQMVDKVDLRQAMSEIGVKASDILFANALILVDGPTEVDIMPTWAKALGMDLDELGVTILSIGGGTKEKPNLRMWREITRNAETPIFMFLDAHSQEEAKKMITENLTDSEHCIVLKENSIEECYQKDHVIKAIDAEWGVSVLPEDLTDTKADTIAALLKKRGILKGEKVENWWKPDLGRQVAKLMKRHDIPTEARRILENVRSELLESA